MRLESFFEKFELFAEAPGAVAKMREFVLQLAAIGKLCPQDRTEEPASQLLDRISEANKSRYASGEIRLRKSVGEHHRHESNVPAGWSPVLLGEIADVNWGNTSLTKNSYAPSGFTAYSATGPDGWIEHAEFSGPGIVLSAIGARSGKCFLAEGQWTAIKNTITIIPFAEVDNDWLFRAVNRESAWTRRGGAQPFIALKDAISLPILLPPSAEQKRIVSKVGELMTLCDRLEAQQQERQTRHASLARASLSRFAEAPTPANLDFLFHDAYAIDPADLRKTILELAVLGKLTAPTPDDGEVPAPGEFREAVAVLANSLDLRSPKEPVDVAEEPFDVPSHWRWITLADLGAAQTGTTPSKSDHEAFDGDIPFIKPGDIIGNAIDYSNESLSRYGAESGSRLAPAGSLLMVCIGTIGKCNLIGRECAFNQQINCLTPIQWVNSGYLLLAVRAPYFQDAAWRRSSSTTIAILNKGKWLSIPVPIPPLAEQRRIVAKVDQLMALVDQLEAQLAASRTAAANLLEAVVAELTA